MPSIDVADGIELVENVDKEGIKVDVVDIIDGVESVPPIRINKNINFKCESIMKLHELISIYHIYLRDVSRTIRYTLCYLKMTIILYLS